MKNILIPFLILTSCSLKAQPDFLKWKKSDRREFAHKKLMSSFNQEKKVHAFKVFEGAIRPKVSLNITDGSGIHLFKIADSGIFPTVNVGAKFKAGIVIII
jgi:hypothetical protein